MTGSGSFWRACCRFKGRCGPCRDHGGIWDGSSAGGTSALRGEHVLLAREAWARAVRATPQPGARTSRARGVGPAVPVVAAPRRRALLAREARALPKARVRLPDPRQGGPGSGQAQTRGRVLLRPRLPRHARRRRAGLRVLQAMEGAHWPPATDALAIVRTAGLLTRTILTRPTEETRPNAPLCGIRPRSGHLACRCAT